MGAITTELVEDGEKRDNRGRRRAPAARRAELVKAYEDSGLTMAAFARREGLNYTTLAHWVMKLEQMSQRWGTSISRRTMSDWVEITAEWLAPIYRQMHRGLLAGDYLQADETPVRCNDPYEKRGGTTQGYLWVISRPGADVVFDWRLSRRHGELTSLLDGFKGVLQSDAYEAYPSYVRTHDGVAWVGAAGRMRGDASLRRSARNRKRCRWCCD
jgi:hypothetical protein